MRLRLLVTMVTWLTGSSWCPPAPICFFHLPESHVVQMFGWSNKGKNGSIMWYFWYFTYIREYVYFLSHSPMNKVHFYILMWFMLTGFVLKVAFGQCFRCQFRRREFEILCILVLLFLSMWKTVWHTKSFVYNDVKNPFLRRFSANCYELTKSTYALILKNDILLHLLWYIHSTYILIYHEVTQEIYIIPVNTVVFWS